MQHKKVKSVKSYATTCASSAKSGAKGTGWLTLSPYTHTPARIERVHVLSHTITVETEDSRTLSVPSVYVPSVCDATYKQRRKFRIVQDATAIEWPEIGVTVTLAELFGVK